MLAVSPHSTLPLPTSHNRLGAVRQAGEPVFTVTQDSFSPSLVQDLRIGLDDPALMNALMLTLAFASNGGNTNAECLAYKGQAISHINQKIGFPEVTATDSTILAILLLVGIEARLSTSSDYLSWLIMNFS